MMRLVVLAALVCAAAATAPERRPTEESRHCRVAICPDREQFEEANCESYEIAQKIFQAGVMDDCCATFKCVVNPETPCGGVQCRVPNGDEQARDEWCNENLFPNDEVWNNLQTKYGAMYSYLVRPAADRAGRCCDEFRCKVNDELLCENNNKKTPCPDRSTCPLCHEAVVRVQANPEEGRCCDEIACVPDYQCLCETREEVCEEPICDEIWELSGSDTILNLNYPVTIYEANPAASVCCPLRVCQDDKMNICLAERDRRGWDIETVCDPCEDLIIIHEEDLPAGKCFPEYECRQKNDECCGFDFNTCANEPTDAGECESYVSVQDNALNDDTVTSPCCPVWARIVDRDCLCDLQDTAAGGGEFSACEYQTAEDYRLAQCPETTKDGLTNLYEIEGKESDRANGRCCPIFKCVKTPEAQLRNLRNQKGPLVAQTTAK